MRRAVTRLARRNFGFAGTQIKTPSDWESAATQAIATARTHVDAINGKNRDPLRTLRRLDAVSVALCSVLDPAALCVAAHECDDWRAAASGAAARVECVMEELNGDAALASAAAACAAANDLPPSARRLADAFHAEFSRDGHFAAARALEHQAVQLLFATDFDEGASWLRVPCVGAERVAAAVDAAAPGCASASGDSVDLFPRATAVSAFLTVSHDATARKIVFDHHEAALNFDALDVLASARRGVVTAHSALEGSLIGGVEAAKAFVDAALATAKRRAAFEERRGAVLLGLERLEPSDRLAAAHRLRERQSTDDGDVVAADLRRAAGLHGRRGPVRRRRGLGAGRAEAPNSLAGRARRSTSTWSRGRASPPVARTIPWPARATSTGAAPMRRRRRGGFASRRDSRPSGRSFRRAPTRAPSRTSGATPCTARSTGRRVSTWLGRAGPRTRRNSPRRRWKCWRPGAGATRAAWRPSRRCAGPCSISHSTAPTVRVKAWTRLSN